MSLANPQTIGEELKNEEIRDEVNEQSGETGEEEGAE